MARFNLGNFLNKEVFNTREFKHFTSTIGSVTGQFVDYAKNMANNMMKMSQNLSSFMSTSYFPYIILGVGGLIVLWKLKIT